MVPSLLFYALNFCLNGLRVGVVKGAGDVYNTRTKVRLWEDLFYPRLYGKDQIWAAIKTAAVPVFGN